MASGAIKQKFTTVLLTGSIAVSADGRVLAVDENCLGVFANRDPRLRILELSSGKRIREVSGRGTGVRYSVSISADGSRFLAFTGKVKMKFDWSDAVPQDVRVYGAFSVWNLSNAKDPTIANGVPIKSAGKKLALSRDLDNWPGSRMGLEKDSRSRFGIVSMETVFRPRPRTPNGNIRQMRRFVVAAEPCEQARNLAGVTVGVYNPELEEQRRRAAVSL